MTRLALIVALAGCARAVPAPVTGTTPSGLYYEAAGEGEPIVLMHGFSLDHRAWAPQMTALAARYRVIRYDLRGHGLSADITGPFAAREDLREVLDALGIEAAALVGLSAGAQIAIDFALTHPARVTRLVLAAPGLGGYVPREPFDWMRPVLEAAAAGDPAEAARRWSETRLMAVPANAAGDSLMRAIVTDNAKIWAYRSNPEQPLSPPAIGRLSDIAVPALILVGEMDLPDTRRVADTLAACIAGATLRVVPAAGHMVNLAAPGPFADAVIGFLDAPGRAPSTTSPCQPAGRAPAM